MGIKYFYLKVETRLLFASPMKISGYAPDRQCTDLRPSVRIHGLTYSWTQVTSFVTCWWHVGLQKIVGGKHTPSATGQIESFSW